MNWASLTDDILETLVLNQTQLAELCKVSQQSVSNWRSGIRSPGVYARNTLRTLGSKAKLNMETYRLVPYQKKKSQSSTVHNGEISDELLIFARRLSALPKKQRDKIMDLAEFLISRN